MENTILMLVISLFFVAILVQIRTITNLKRQRNLERENVNKLKASLGKANEIIGRLQSELAKADKNFEVLEKKMENKVCPVAFYPINTNLLDGDVRFQFTGQFDLVKDGTVNVKIVKGKLAKAFVVKGGGKTRVELPVTIYSKRQKAYK